MQIKGCDARRVGVYKGRELPNKPPPQKKKIKKKRLEQQEEGEREREQCVSLHKNITLGGAYNEPSIYLFLTTIHSLLVWIFGLELDLFYPLFKQIFTCLDLVRRYRLHYSKWIWAPNFRVLTTIIIIIIII